MLNNGRKLCGVFRLSKLAKFASFGGRRTSLIQLPRFDRRLTSILMFVIVVLLKLALPDTVCAQSTYYIAPDGIATNSGTLNSPWDIQSAWAGQQSIAPGDTLLMLGGTYRHPDRTWQSPGFSITLAGIQEKPITIRSYQGQRVTIDGKVEVSSTVMICTFGNWKSPSRKQRTGIALSPRVDWRLMVPPTCRKVD